MLMSFGAELEAECDQRLLQPLREEPQQLDKIFIKANMLLK